MPDPVVTDGVGVADSATAEIIRPPGKNAVTVILSPCCGKPAKETQKPEELRCSLCKKVFKKEDGKSTIEYTGPRFPCPKCGKESKETSKPPERICSAHGCRHRFTPE